MTSGGTFYCWCKKHLRWCLFLGPWDALRSKPHAVPPHPRWMGHMSEKQASVISKPLGFWIHLLPQHSLAYPDWYRLLNTQYPYVNLFLTYLLSRKAVAFHVRVNFNSNITQPQQEAEKKTKTQWGQELETQEPKQSEDKRWEPDMHVRV